MIINVESIQSSQSHEKPNFENVVFQSFLITCVPGGLTLCSIADCLFPITYMCVRRYALMQILHAAEKLEIDLVI